MPIDLDFDEFLRLIAFFAGLLLLLSGLGDLAGLGGVEVFGVISTGATGILKVIFGVFLMVAGLNPDAVKMVVEVFLKR